jgi:diketogulonate reductase-like aldo/keto reductase
MELPRMGQGTWHLGDDPAKRAEEIAALREGVSLGMTMIDTAEMYGEGRAETLVGEAIRQIPREKLYLVSKVYPHNAGKSRIFRSAESSLRRMGTEYMDLYLLHWRGGASLPETVECMEELKRRGLILNWGVSNFDTVDMKELFSFPDGDHCAVNQVLYHLGSRGIEYELLPFLKDHRVPVMAYCPLAQQSLLKPELFASKAVREVAARHHLTPAQVLLGFILRDPFLIPIPKAGSVKHARENAAMLSMQLMPDEIELLSNTFPAPGYKTPLDVE